jgi:bifunctional non-homologous end joining protein LigD
LPDEVRRYFEQQRSRTTQRAATLDTYEAKRDFKKTAEPKPGARGRSRQGSRRRFVIQKHAASHLHYDFRLEMHDVLKSWSVPKGPPFKKDERRLAMPTEDHPIDYLDFEGIIPKGQYGGGTVMVWDIGTYEVIEGNYYKGMLRVYLNGQKLKGEWTLQRFTDGKDDRDKWRLIKTDHNTRAVSKKRDDESALTKRTMAQIAAAADAHWQSNRR